MSGKRTSWIVLALVTACGRNVQLLEPGVDVVVGRGLRVDVVDAHLEAGQRVDGLLRSGGIIINGDAYALLYQLNPNIESLDDLPAGVSIRVPRLTRADGEPCDRSCATALVLNGGAKGQLHRMRYAVGDLAVALRETPRSRFEARDLADPFYSAVSDIPELVVSLDNAAQDKRHALSPLLLQQGVDALAVGEQVLAAIHNSPAPISAQSVERLTALRDDLHLRLSCCDEVMGPGEQPTRSDVRVRVHTRRGGAEIGDLRVVAVAVALRGDATKNLPFATLSSPTARDLPPARYVIWAVRPGTTIPVTEELVLPVARQRAPLEVDLAVLEP